MTALLLIATGLFVGLVQALLMAVLGQAMSEGNRSKSRTALVMSAIAYLLSARLFLAAGVQLAARL